MMNIEIDDAAWPGYDDVLAQGNAFEDALEDTLDRLEEHGPQGVPSRSFEGNTYLTTMAVIGADASVYVVFEWAPPERLVTVRGIGYKRLPPRAARLAL